jgi:tetratricopeptide (TPR) repeat protein
MARPCLLEEEVLDFYAGRLDDVALEALETHTDDCAQCRVVLSEAAVAYSATCGADGQRGRVSLSPGDRLGRYVISSRIGAGAMGVVYAARDPELDRPVALKLLHAGVDDDPQRWLRDEAQALARLSHPNVVTVYDVGTVGRAVFIAMELVDGRTLTAWLAERPQPWRQILDAFLAAGRGLHAAHRAGLVHRDFKPDNVLVADGDDGLRVRVADFGLAQVRTSETPSGRTRVGTPAYMSPEQLAGAPLDARSDQYGFCVALWEALCGTRPVGRLGTAVPRGTSAPAALFRVLRRGLEQTPDARFPDMDRLLVALAHAASSHRRRALALGTLATLVLLGIGAVRLMHPTCAAAARDLDGVYGPTQRAALRAAFTRSGQPGAAEALRQVEAGLAGYAREWAAMRTNACEATRVRGVQSAEVMDLRMSCLDARLGDLRARMTLLSSDLDAKLVETAPRTVELLPAISECGNVTALQFPESTPPRDKAAAVSRLRPKLAEARALMDAARYSQALALARAVVSDAHALGYRPLEAEALLLVGSVQMFERDVTAADATLMQAASLALASRHDLVAARALQQRLTVVGGPGRKFEQAREIEPIARAALERVGNPPVDLALLERAVGNMYEEHDDHAQALAHFQRALEIVPKDTPWEEKVQNALSTIYGRMGQHAEAYDHCQRALELTAKQLGSEHAEYGNVLTLCGLELNDLGRRNEAGTAFQRSVDILAKTRGTDSVDYAYSLANLANLYDDAGNYAEAIAADERVVAVLKKRLGPQHPDVAQVLGNLGRSYLHHGEPRRNLAVQEEALAMVEASLGKDSNERAFYLKNIGEAQLELKAPARAVAPLEEAVRVLESFGADPVEIALSRFMLARAVAAGGDRDRARTLVQAARKVFASTPGQEDMVKEADRWIAQNGART